MIQLLEVLFISAIIAGIYCLSRSLSLAIRLKWQASKDLRDRQLALRLHTHPLHKL